MKISVRDLKNRLSEYLRRVAAGEEITVTSHKRPIARLVPIGNVAEEQADYTAATVQDHLKAMPWLRWSGGKPKARRATRPKPGRKSISDSLLEDRR